MQMTLRYVLNRLSQFNLKINLIFTWFLQLLTMRDNFVNNVEEILSANESQKNKIEFLERERTKRDHYLSDLQESLSLNKETLKEYNAMGCNQKAIDKLIMQADLLSQKIKEYYEEYQNINAVLLMEKQMRLEDKQFYQERVIEFQNKLVDLRKYLHDKEESFTSVIYKLKRYEEMSQISMQEKLQAYKKEMGDRSTNEFIADLIKEKNFYKSQYQKMKKDYIVFSDMRNTIASKYEDVEIILQNFERENAVKIKSLVGNIYQKMEEDKKANKRVEPNKELIRLLKKEKLNNQLLEEALNDAIQKNQQLVALKDIFEKSAERLKVRCNLLYSQNTILALKIGEYDRHFCRRHAHSKKFYEQGDIKGLSFIVNDRLKDYAKNIYQFYQTNAKLYQQYNQKLKADVEKWSNYLCDSYNARKQITKKNVLMKSCSTPKLIVGIDLDEMEGDKLIIQEF